MCKTAEQTTKSKLTLVTLAVNTLLRPLWLVYVNCFVHRIPVAIKRPTQSPRLPCAATVTEHLHHCGCEPLPELDALLSNLTLLLFSQLLEVNLRDNSNRDDTVVRPILVSLSRIASHRIGAASDSFASALDRPTLP